MKVLNRREWAGSQAGFHALVELISELDLDWLRRHYREGELRNGGSPCRSGHARGARVVFTGRWGREGRIEIVICDVCMGCYEAPWDVNRNRD